MILVHLGANSHFCTEKSCCEADGPYSLCTEAVQRAAARFLVQAHPRPGAPAAQSPRPLRGYGRAQLSTRSPEGGPVA